MTETEIQRGLTDLLQHLGFMVYHTRYSIGSDRGFPDILAARDDGKLVAIECKGPRGRVSDEQFAWLELFRAVPGCVFCEIVGPRSAMGWTGYNEALELIQEALR